MPERVGPYDLVRPIGSGGMGQVHLARHVGPEGFEKLIVLKTLRPDHAVDPRFVAMFLDEARLAARLLHPHVVQIFDFGEAGGIYYIAMEYVPGVDVASLRMELSRRGQPLPLALACRVVIDAASGLHYAHELKGPDGQPLGLVHRDVSPQNILVGYEGAVKVIDFGIAKAAGRLTQTRTGALKGKFAYMSPEQAAGEAIDRRSDVFALGVVFHELVTGTRLFERDTETETLRAVQDCAIPTASKLNPECPSAIDAVLAKALAKERDDRFATAQDFLNSVEGFVVESRSPASQSQLARFLQGIFPENQVRESTPSSVPDTVVSGKRSSAGTGFAPTTVSKASKRRKLGIGLAAALGIAAILAILMLRRGPTSGAAAPAANTRPTTATAQKVKLVIETRPRGAEVLLDGVLLGQTPIAQITDARPSARLAIRSPGFVEANEVIDLRSDFLLRRDLKPDRIDLLVDSKPQGATVRLGDQELGTTPIHWQVAPSEEPVRLTLSLRGYRDETVEVTLRAGATLPVVALRRQPGKTALPFAPDKQR